MVYWMYFGDTDLMASDDLLHWIVLEMKRVKNGERTAAPCRLLRQPAGGTRPLCLCSRRAYLFIYNSSNAANK